MPSPPEPDAPRARSGEAAYKKALEAVAERNARTHKAAKQQREVFEQKKAELRAKDARRYE
jgi:hypothetical protein